MLYFKNIKQHDIYYNKKTKKTSLISLLLQLTYTKKNKK
jgi:hypothetical protein